MKKEDKKDEYCILLSGKIIKDLTRTEGRTTYPLFKVETTIIRLSDEESKNDATIERLLVNRLPEKLEVMMSDEPKNYIRKLFSLEEKEGATHLYACLSLKGLLF